jgi:hypothetical protein
MPEPLNGTGRGPCFRSITRASRQSREIEVSTVRIAARCAPRLLKFAPVHPPKRNVLLRFTILIWTLLALAWSPLAHAGDAPIVVLNSAWNRALASQLCSKPVFKGALPPDVSAACPFDPTAGLTVFERELTTQFAADPKCKNIRLLSLARKAEPNSYWDLRISYFPGKPMQVWQLFAPLDNLHFFEGKGDQQKIADAVCSLVTEQGAKIN